MAIVRIEPAGRSMRRWLMIGGVALIVGVVTGAILSRPSASGPAVDAGASTGASTSASTGAPPLAAAAPAMKPATLPLGTGSSPQDLYRKALHYAGCLALQDPDRQPAAAPTGPDERYEIDPTGALAARLIREEQEQRTACQRVGPYEHRQIKTLMQEAAARGNQDARFYLLDERVRDTLTAALAMRDSGQSVAGSPSDAALVADVEKMALAGHRPAMTLLAQLLSSDLLAPRDPQRSAAWHLAQTQLGYAQPMTEDQLGGTGLFEELSPEQALALKGLAAALLERCCAANKLPNRSSRASS